MPASVLAAASSIRSEPGSASGAPARTERRPAGRFRGPAGWRDGSLGDARGRDPPVALGKDRQHDIFT